MTAESTGKARALTIRVWAVVCADGTIHVYENWEACRKLVYEQSDGGRTDAKEQVAFMNQRPTACGPHAVFAFTGKRIRARA